MHSRSMHQNRVIPAFAMRGPVVVLYGNACRYASRDPLDVDAAGGWSAWSRTSRPPSVPAESNRTSVGPSKKAYEAAASQAATGCRPPHPTKVVGPPMARILPESSASHRPTP
jgi:hypothetical protein